MVPNVWHEHAVYLHYICAFYNHLPPLTAFLHGHRIAWHNRQQPAIAQLKRLPLKRLAKVRAPHAAHTRNVLSRPLIRIMSLLASLAHGRSKPRSVSGQHITLPPPHSPFWIYRHATATRPSIALLPPIPP